VYYSEVLRCFSLLKEDASSLATAQWLFLIKLLAQVGLFKSVLKSALTMLFQGKGACSVTGYDGLTKALLKQKRVDFQRLLGFTDVSDLLELIFKAVQHMY
jgi:hypothetical protein